MGVVLGSDEPPSPTDTRRDSALVPYVGQDSVPVLDEAVTSLVLMRSPMWLGDAGPTISVLVSIVAQAQEMLCGAVMSARDQGYTWDEVAGRLACSTTTARRRYSVYRRPRPHTPGSPSTCDDGD